ncbi:hypothetical protein NQ318_010851 [Aromia moschata]|uniref:PX domain-containing protein n=1 Tax=Aromia moschata TaxID=1265417 RepID=A0AAV8YG62_9CUCU|nr:hypothetical protein NQ318_010851 [Aromia moschata]
MTPTADSISTVKTLTPVHPLLTNNNNEASECEAAEEAITSDSEEYLSEPLRYRNYQYSTQSCDSNITLLAQNMTILEENDNFYTHNGSINSGNIQIPIVGYEIMEERARFTKIRRQATVGTCFGRYTDFVRLCNRLRNNHPQVVQHLPRKRWLKNNFDPLFLEERVNGLQTLVNAILGVPDLIASQEIQDFFCFNEPPICSETNEESRAMFEALEETINDLKQQLREKESMIDTLQTNLHSKEIENKNLIKLLRKSTINCQTCQKECDSVTKLIK